MIVTVARWTGRRDADYAAGMDSPVAFPAGQRRTLTHCVTAAELGPVAALLGSADPALAPRAAATLMTRMLVTRFPGPGTRLLRENFRYAGRLVEGDTIELAVEVAGPADGGPRLALLGARRSGARPSSTASPMSCRLRSHRRTTRPRRSARRRAA